MLRLLVRLIAALCLSPLVVGAQAAAPDSATVRHDHSMADLVVTAIQSLRLKVGTGPAYIGQASLTKIVKLSPAALTAVSAFARDSLGMRVTATNPTGVCTTQSGEPVCRATIGPYILFTSLRLGADSAIMIGRIYGAIANGAAGNGTTSGGATGPNGSSTLAFCIEAFESRDVWYVWLSQTLPILGEVIGPTPPPLPPYQNPCDKRGRGGR
jgi:hypothetical protein